MRKIGDRRRRDEKRKEVARNKKKREKGLGRTKRIWVENEKTEEEENN
jgi:hypothetical protein